MIYLKPEYWKKFNKDGILFEELVGEILKYRYPDITFEHTGQPGDGGKDFEYTEPKDNKIVKIWAECKYHENNLPIHDVANTMLMAFIEKANKVLIFSYSPVNRNFSKHIARYKKRTKTNVEVYSDIELEKLIINYADEINFKKYFDFDYNTIKTIEEKNDFDCSYTLHPSVKRQKNTVLAYINDIMLLELYLFNNGDSKVDIDIKMDNKDTFFDVGDNIFVKNNYSLRKTILPHTSEVINFNIRLKPFTHSPKFPSIQVTTDTNIKKSLKIKSKLDCRWVAETDILGDEYINCLKLSDNLIAANNELSIITIDGKSGVGKSRIIEEISFKCIQNNKVVYISDTDKVSLSSKVFINKIVSELSQLPIFSASTMSKINKNIIHDLNIKDEKLYAFKVLYDKDFDIYHERDNIAYYIFEYIKNNPCYIIMNNVQKYDETIIYIINKIIELSKKSKMQSGFVFSFNKDFLFKDTEPYKFWIELKALASKSPKTTSYFPLTGFSKNDAKRYIKQCLEIKDTPKQDKIDYNRTITKIVEKVGTNPFFLQNYLLFLNQSGILNRSQYTSFYISDPQKFRESFKIIPNTINGLLCLREELFIKHFLNDESIETQYYKFLNMLVFLKCMPVVIYNKIINNNKLLKLLIEAGFIKISEDKSIIFYHQYFYEYFKDKYPLEQISEAYLYEFINITEKSYFKKTLIFPLFLAKYSTYTLTQNIFDQVVNKICNYDIDLHFDKQIFKALNQLIYEEEFIITTRKKIDLYNRFIFMSQQKYGINESSKYALRIYNIYNKNPQEYKKYLSDLFILLYENITYYMHISKIDKSLDIIKKLINSIKDNYEETYDTKKILIRLYNFEAIAYNHKYHPEDAISSNAAAMNISKEINDYESVVYTYKTQGDIFYALKNCVNYSKKISESWKSAYNNYIWAYGNDPTSEICSSLKITAYFKGILSDLIKEDLSAANEKLIFINNCLGKTNMMYFEVKIRLIKAVMYIKDFNNIDYEKAVDLIKDAIDICTIYGNSHSLTDCFHMLAIVKYKQKDYDIALDHYKKALNIINGIITDCQDYNYWYSFLIDFAVISKTRKTCSYTKEDLEKFPQNIFVEIASINRMDEIELKNYIEKNGRLNILYDEENHLNFPKI